MDEAAERLYYYLMRNGTNDGKDAISWTLIDARTTARETFGLGTIRVSQLTAEEEEEGEEEEHIGDEEEFWVWYNIEGNNTHGIHKLVKFDFQWGEEGVILYIYKHLDDKFD